MHASCCEGQGTRLFGQLFAFLFSLLRGPASNPKVSVRVDLYAQAALTEFSLPPLCGGGAGSLHVNTLWPYSSVVDISVILPSPCPQFQLTLALRIPAWVPAPVQIILAGSPYAHLGSPGSYLNIDPPTGVWTSGTTNVSFKLPMVVVGAPYDGSSQLLPYRRYSYLCGPVLMAMQGPCPLTIKKMAASSPPFNLQ